MEILLKNGNLITHLGEILPRCDLLIRDNLICEVGGDIKSKTAQVIECTGKFIAPGFVAMHTHSPMNIFKGIAEDVNIDDWFNKEIWPYESKLTDDDIYWGAKLAAAEMLNNGITAFADHYFKSDIIAKACKELGIKADIAYTIFGFGGNCEEELATACHFCEEYKNDELINPRLGPHSTYLCCEAVLKTIVDTAKKLGVGIHIHLSESQAQVTQSKAMNDGKTPFAVLDKVGGFNIPCIVAHGLYIEDEDIKFLKDDTCVAVCPKTYMKLGMGQGNLWRLHHKLNIVSGNDGSASSNSIDVLEQMRLFALLGKLNDKAESFTVKEIWKDLMNGHNFLNFGSGKLEPGYSADLNIFDLNTLGTTPAYNPLSAIIYSSTSANITHTMVNGKFVKKDGKLCFDEQSIISAANRCAKDIYGRGKGISPLNF